MHDQVAVLLLLHSKPLPRHLLLPLLLLLLLPVGNLLLSPQGWEVLMLVDL
jgi:hypothetical protein